jgi:Ca2+-binding RTX toxin-like protein
MAAPINDNFANRIVLPAIAINLPGTNLEATAEAGEPPFPVPFSAPNETVWWTWTAPSSGNFNLTTAGSNFDTVLAVFTGNAVNALTLVGSNDEDDSVSRQSLVNFNAVAGTSYQIAVDGFLNIKGNINLSIAPAGISRPTFGGGTLALGTNGSDILNGDAGGDTIAGFGGDDLILGGDGNDSIDGGFGNDTIYGGFDTNTLLGNIGDDYLDGSKGTNDVIIGGSGNDTGVYPTIAQFNAAAANGVENAILNNFFGANFSGSIVGGAGNDTIRGADGGVTIDGAIGNDSILGANGNDSLIGGLGNDTISAFGGTDTITGGSGADVITTGSGSNIVRYTDPSDGSTFLFNFSSNANFNSAVAAGGYDLITDFFGLGAAVGDAIDFTSAFVPLVNNFAGSIFPTIQTGAIANANFLPGFNRVFAYDTGVDTYLIYDNDTFSNSGTDTRILSKLVGVTGVATLNTNDFSFSA